MKQYFVYILASKRNGTLYIGVTNNLRRRYEEHKEGVVKGFTNRYSVHLLVHYEQTVSIEAALYREKQLKNWKRKWKIDLINESNSSWRNLAEDFE